MKALVILLFSLMACNCSNTKHDEPRKIKEIVCGDSVEQELFDQNGNVFFVKKPGTCDTIYESTED